MATLFLIANIFFSRWIKKYKIILFTLCLHWRPVMRCAFNCFLWHSCLSIVRGSIAVAVARQVFLWFIEADTHMARTWVEWINWMNNGTSCDYDIGIHRDTGRVKWSECNCLYCSRVTCSSSLSLFICLSVSFACLFKRICLVYSWHALTMSAV